LAIAATNAAAEAAAGYGGRSSACLLPQGVKGLENSRFVLLRESG
jgi:hypothetical protein